MGQVLYRKYRSKSLDEVVGQQHITDTLQKAIKSGRISHAYLFTGPRGVGKTTVARILAHEVNKLPYSSDTVHLDIIEIDAASNRRIDEVRDLREKVHIAPTSAKYKVYIIDEVHMLTREAFNALLKTLEEPPAHCIFILATTEAHKLPETIVSRTQRFTFKPIEESAAKVHLRYIAKEEKIDIDTDALELLAEHGQGSFRDSISLLDQLSALGGKITKEHVKDFLGLPQEDAIARIIKAIERRKAADIILILTELKENGVDAALAARTISSSVRQKIIEQGVVEKRWTLLLKELLEVPASERPYQLLEICLLEAIAAAETVKPADDARQNAIIDIAPSIDLKIDENTYDDRSQDIKPKKTIPANKNLFDLGDWDELLELIKKEAASLYTALRLAEPTISGDELTLSFKFPLHHKKVARAENLKIIENSIENISSSKVKIICATTRTTTTQKDTKVQPESHSIETISNIFGSAEVLES